MLHATQWVKRQDHQKLSFWQKKSKNEKRSMKSGFLMCSLNQPLRCRLFKDNENSQKYRTIRISSMTSYFFKIKDTTVSTWNVCGNISNGWTSSTEYILDR